MRRIATVPARANIIGEHTDHRGGLALPFATQHRLTLTASEREQGFTGKEEITSLWKAAGGWPADLELVSEIPVGAGMSSSAALCVALALCIKGDRGQMETCLEAQRIEHELMESPCGLLDQIAITHASENHAVTIDFSDLSVTPFRIPEGWKFKIIDTGIRRHLKDTEYGRSNVSENDWEKHVNEESERVREAISCDSIRLGELLNQSHISLSQRIRVSTPEIDNQVETVQSIKGVLGARLMGGGFGGMILALVDNQLEAPGDLIMPSQSAVLQEIV
tara:strand:- start:180 stop:1013 length:834 start_codon:yes stop_codon:yes gene_type:complete